MKQIAQKILAQLNMKNEQIKKKIGEIIEKKQIKRFCTMKDELALFNSKIAYIYNLKYGKLLYQFTLTSMKEYSTIRLYFVKFIKLNNVKLLLLVMTDRIQILQKNKLIFQLQIKYPLYKYEQFYFDPLTNYLAITGTTFREDFSLIILAKLFSREYNEKFLTPNYFRYTLDYKCIFFNTGEIFKTLTTDYLIIDSICFLSQDKMFLYNKNAKELYYCDLEELRKIYETGIDYSNYQHTIFKIDQSQDALPLQAIRGVYNGVLADSIKGDRNKLILVQQKDPISEKIVEEEYMLADGGTLKYMKMKNRKRE